MCFSFSWLLVGVFIAILFSFFFCVSQWTLWIFAAVNFLVKMYFIFEYFLWSDVGLVFFCSSFQTFYYSYQHVNVRRKRKENYTCYLVFGYFSRLFFRRPQFTNWLEHLLTCSKVKNNNSIRSVRKWKNQPNGWKNIK